MCLAVPLLSGKAGSTCTVVIAGLEAAGVGFSVTSCQLLTSTGQNAAAGLPPMPQGSSTFPLVLVCSSPSIQRRCILEDGGIRPGHLCTSPCPRFHRPLRQFLHVDGRHRTERPRDIHLPGVTTTQGVAAPRSVDYTLHTSHTRGYQPSASTARLLLLRC